MLDLLRIHVLWADGSSAASKSADVIASHFDGLGMERDGVAHRVPVRFASEPWDLGSKLPRPIDLSRASHNIVVLLHDDYMHEEFAAWDAYTVDLRAKMNARAGADVYVPFGSPTGEPALPTDAAVHTQYAYRAKWTGLPSADAREKRLLLHLVFKIREHLRAFRSVTAAEPLFVSHAKADGDVTARAIVDFVNDSGHDVPLETFYDAMELSPGEDYEARFLDEIKRGTLLAIVSDVYDSRPWCVFELTAAKRERRPIVLADVGQVRISRTYPYGANLPRVKINPIVGDTSWIEPLLVETLSEGLRCDLFEGQARRTVLAAAAGDALILPRPPELFDLVERDVLESLVVYPDPPLGKIESSIVERAIAQRGIACRICTLAELGS